MARADCDLVSSPLHLLLVIVITLACNCLARPAPHSSAPAQAAGRETRLLDWARANGFQVRWLRRNEALQLSKLSAKILLTVDSREAQINGVLVWLSFPVAFREGVPWISQSDVQTTLQPLLAPLRTRGPSRINLVCLDPGHGGKDPGNRVGPFQEKKYTLLLAQEVGRQLSHAGLNISLTRATDSFIDLPVRPDLARRKNADLFVSLHFNSVENSRTVVRGAEVYCLTPAGASSTNARGEGGSTASCPGNKNNDKNLFLAYQVQKSLTRSLSVEDRGVRRARFAVLRDASMPAILIEAGFMSHPEESKRIFDAGYRRQMAHAIVDGLLAYKRAVEQRS